MDALARPVLALAIPGSIVLVMFAPDRVELVFHRGAFDAAAIASTGDVLRGIAAGLWATTLGWILVRMLNSAGRNRRATVIVGSAYIANALASSLLVDRLGGFALGFGEAIRGVVILTGVTLALRCGRHLLRLLALPAAAVLIAGAGLVRVEVSGLLPRLFSGGGVTALAAALSLWMTVPRVRYLVLSRLRGAMP